MKNLVIILILYSGISFSQQIDVDSVSHYLLEYVNEHRINNGVSEVVYDPLLNIDANNHVKYIYHEVVVLKKKGGFSHTQTNIENPHYVSENFRDRVNRPYVGENICTYRHLFFDNNKHTAKVIFDKWLNSPSHNDNMLSPEYKKMGLGFVFDREGQKVFNGFVVQIFSN